MDKSPVIRSHCHPKSFPSEHVLFIFQLKISPGDIDKLNYSHFPDLNTKRSVSNEVSRGFQNANNTSLFQEHFKAGDSFRSHQADRSGLRGDIGVPDLGDEFHPGGLEGIAGRDVDVDHKGAPLERRSLFRGVSDANRTQIHVTKQNNFVQNIARVE